MRVWKRLAALLLSLSLLLFCAACGDKKSESSDSGEDIPVGASTAEALDDSLEDLG